MNAQSLLAKINELDKKLEEFTRSAMMSSAQMKNIEESKISARREIEDLLKVVREQQKYSEMDRQMHDQLEKSWHRVEDLEKKLMDFYALSMSKSAEDGKAGRRPLLEDEAERIADSGFRKFLSDMDSRFKLITEKLDGQSPALMRKSEERVSAMVSNLDARLTSFEIEFRKLYLTISSSEESIRALYDGVKSEMLAALKESIREENEAMRKYIDGFALDTEERVDAMSGLVAGRLDELLVQAGGNEARLEKMEAAANMSARQSRSDLSVLSGKIEEMLRKNSADTGERIRIETAKNAETIMEFSRLSAYSLSGAAALSGGLDALSGRLEKLRGGITGFVDGFKNVRLESLPGVSGALVRKNFEGLLESLKELEKEQALFEKQKAEITANLKTLAEKMEKSGKGER